MRPDALPPMEPRPAASLNRWLGWAALGAALLPLGYVLGLTLPDELGAPPPPWAVAALIGIPAAPLLGLAAWVTGRGKAPVGRRPGCLGLGLWLPVVVLVSISLAAGGASRNRARSKASSWQIEACLEALAEAGGKASAENLDQRLAAWSAGEHNLWFRSRPPLCPDGLQVVSGDPAAEARARARRLGVLVVAYRPPQGSEPGVVAGAIRVKPAPGVEEVRVHARRLEPKTP